MAKLKIDWDMLNAWHWNAVLARNAIENGRSDIAKNLLDDMISSLNEKRGA